jgi:hypothetical protein
MKLAFEQELWKEELSLKYDFFDIIAESIHKIKNKWR